MNLLGVGVNAYGGGNLQQRIPRKRLVEYLFERMVLRQNADKAITDGFSKTVITFYTWNRRKIDAYQCDARSVNWLDMFVKLTSAQAADDETLTFLLRASKDRASCWQMAIVSLRRCFKTCFSSSKFVTENGGLGADESWNLSTTSPYIVCITLCSIGCRWNSCWWVFDRDTAPPTEWLRAPCRQSCVLCADSTQWYVAV